MSKRRKPSHKQKLQQRLDRLPYETDVPSPQAVDAYIDAYQWAADNPEKAAEVVAIPVEDIEHFVVGIAYSEKLAHPDEEIEKVAGVIQTWHILNGFKYFYDWWTVPIAAMTVEEIVAQIKADKAAGRVRPLLDTDGQVVDDTVV